MLFSFCTVNQYLAPLPEVVILFKLVGIFTVTGRISSGLDTWNVHIHCTQHKFYHSVLNCRPNLWRVSGVQRVQTNICTALEEVLVFRKVYSLFLFSVGSSSSSSSSSSHQHHAVSHMTGPRRILRTERSSASFVNRQYSHYTCMAAKK